MKSTPTISAIVFAGLLAFSGAAFAQDSSSGMTATTPPSADGTTNGAVTDTNNSMKPKGVQATKCKGVKATDPQGCSNSPN